MVSNELGIIQMVTGAGLMVQFVLLLLLFFSLSSWTIIIVKFLYIRKAYNESILFLDFFWRSRDLTDAFTKAKQ